MSGEFSFSQKKSMNTARAVITRVRTVFAWIEVTSTVLAKKLQVLIDSESNDGLDYSHSSLKEKMTQLIRRFVNRQILLISVFFILSRFLAIRNNLEYDGNRLVNTFMQFPDVKLLNWENFLNVFFNFHFSAPGLPLTFIFLESIAGDNWQLIGWVGISLLALGANLIFYSFLVRVGVGTWKSLCLTFVFLTLNPSLILYEAQFYSTAFVSYVLIILFYIFYSKDTKTPTIGLICIFLLSALGLTRSSFLLLIILPLSLLILFKIDRASKGSFVAIVLGAILILIPMSSQISRVINYGQITMQSSGSTGIILGLTSYPNFKGLPYAESGYYPFGEIVTNDSSGSSKLRSDINEDLRKSNGLPNWNADQYLRGYKLDSKHLTQVLYQNKSLLPYFFRDSLGWSATNPACSRVITLENYGAVSFLDKGLRDVLMLRTPFVKSNSQLVACGGFSKFDLLYLLILAAYIFALIKICMRLRVAGVKSVSGPAGLLLHILVLSSLALSLLNGSPETSKYRAEFEPYLVMFVLLYLINQRPIKDKSRKKIGNVN